MTFFIRPKNLGGLSGPPSAGTLIAEPNADAGFILEYLIACIFRVCISLSEDESRIILTAVATQIAFRSGALPTPITIDQRLPEHVALMRRLVEIYNRKVQSIRNAPIMVIVSEHPKGCDLFFKEKPNA